MPSGAADLWRKLQTRTAECGHPRCAARDVRSGQYYGIQSHLEDDPGRSRGGQGRQ